MRKKYFCKKHNKTNIIKKFITNIKQKKRKEFLQKNSNST